MTTHDDDALALSIARDVTDSEAEAADLIEQARAQVKRLLKEHETAVGCVAHSLLLNCELGGADVARLIRLED